ncbi:endospore germination permease [Neobacillus drentensis]|uniref:GerAB/ArcD/ProY family transporter n=1 Tax=Neobacillus drentensis TaxID=220684 RepID=UPI003001F5B4
MNQKVIQSAHIYVLLIMSTGFMVHVILLPSILTSSGRDSWLSVIASTVPFIMWILLIFYIYKKFKNNDIFSLFINLPKWLSFGISFLFGIYFFMTAFITLKFTVFWAKANYTLDVPNFVVVFLFSFTCFYASYKGIRTISTLALAILPLVSMFGFLVGIGNMNNKNYNLLFPIFENGFVGFFEGIIYTCSGLFEIIFLLFLTPYLKDRLKAKWLIFVGFILVALSLGPLMGAITEFGSVEATKLKNPAYEQWKLLILGVHITRLDFLSIFQWLSGAFIRISINMFIMNKLFSPEKKKNWVLPILYLLLMIGVLIQWNATSFYFFLHQIYFPVRTVFLCLTPVLFLILIRIKGDAS